MKNKGFVLLGVLSSLILTSCRISFLKTKKMEMNVTSLFNGEVNNDRTISYQVLEGQELLPYFTINSYLSLQEPYLDANFKFDISKEGSDTSVVVKPKKGGETYFAASISPSNQMLYENGDYSSLFSFSTDYSKSSLTLYSQTDSRIAVEPVTIREFTFSNMGFFTFKENNEVYYPLSLLENIFAPYSGVHHFYNYSRLVQYSSYEELTDTAYSVDGETITAFKEMNKYMVNNSNVMPLYLREDRLASFLFTLENQYGLKYTRKISSMRRYLKEQPFYEDFLSESNLKRNEAYAKTFALLDDGHTSYSDHKDFPYKEGEFNPYGSHMQRILTVRQMLSNQRPASLAPGGVYYSSDNKLAFFTFDNFVFAENAYEEDGKTLKEDLSNYNSENYDTYFYFIKCLNEIKEKGGVEDVVIDISTNGGGVIGIMMKLLTLLNKYNYSYVYMSSDVTDLVQEAVTRVDSNMDGNFDEKDIFGNEFNIHILTSEFSFSCGNAFPFYAKKNGIASIIGQKSGGGECAVSEAYLPSGEHYRHSSSTHIGWCKDRIFEGDEQGVTPDLVIEYDDYYNLDRLQALIKESSNA